ncbi:MAG TPA: DoxX family protein [Pedobacter sp.]|jgi:uncharacterized membrane protein YphA (DoxX/SURF4 family)
MKNKTANVIAWILQILLALMFIMTGAMKLFLPLDQLADSLPWVADSAPAFVRFIGIAELLGGLGLILPGLFKFRPVLTIFAAGGIILIMIFASIFHVSRGESPVIGMNFVIAVLAAIIIWLRLKKAPLQLKGQIK